jgi:NOL1/NOP2/sun family putative RNA methylase
MNKTVPEFFLNRLNEAYGENLSNKIIDGYVSSRKVTLRVNTLKATKEEVIKAFNDNNIIYQEVDFYNDAFIIDNVKENDLWKLDIYNEGKIYLQSLSSMLPPLFLDIDESSHILDMAAAPGGKTTQMAALSSNKACITACELNPLRAEKLKHNVEKLGATRTNVMVKDARQLDEFMRFNKILLDAPCSGSGTLDLTKEKAFIYFTDKLIEKSTKAQLALIKKGLQILSKGGTMIYSTCSILPSENEEILKQILKTGKVKIEPIEIKTSLPLELLPTTLEGVICVKPNEYFEGFFVSKLIKL